MSNQFIKKQLDFIVTNVGLTDIYEIDKIRYGLEVFYGETSKIIIMVLIALLLDKLPAFILMITLLMLIRPFIGGSHAKTFISCVVQSNVSFIVIYYFVADSIRCLTISKASTPVATEAFRESISPFIGIDAI